MASNSRFGNTSENEAAQIRANLHSKDTLKSNRNAASLLKAYLKEKRENINFEILNVDELNIILKKFYLDARKMDGTKYKSSSMTNFRHSLNRYLNGEPFNQKIDIVKDERFAEANKKFSSMLAVLKREGLGETKHYEAISQQDLVSISNSLFFNPDTPTGLLNKVQFDIRLYFFRRGAENMHSMTRNTFEVKQIDGITCVVKKLDELSKNHREFDTGSSGGGIMPSMTNNIQACPVRSFVKYTSKLNPSCTKLWQRPRDSFCTDDDIWYCNVGVGEKSLQKFMPEISRKVPLSKIYSNHCIRATGATILSKSKFNAAQIMSVTGHKSVSSLSVYQKVGEQEKVDMGRSIGEYASGGCSSLVKFQLQNEYQDLVLDDWDNDLDIQPAKQQQQNSTELALNRMKSIFTNCTISNVHIHINN